MANAIRAFVSAVGLALLAAACEDAQLEEVDASSAGASGEPAAEQGLAAEIRARADIRFALADFIKPQMEGDSGLDPYLAPIFYRELESTEDPTHPPELFGRVERDADGLLRVDPARPAVYFESSTVLVAGEERARYAFRWFHASEIPGELAPQGVRVTLSAERLPAVFEVLADSTALDIVYATLEVEAAAVAQFGAALQGRTYALERKLDERPRTVVAGLSATGPMALGPFLYIGRGATDLLGLHCRCEPSRVDVVRENVEYELVPLSALRALGAEVPEWPAADIDVRLRLASPEGE